MDWSDVDYLWIIEMLLSSVLTLILTAPIHWARDVLQHFPKFDEETNTFVYIEINMIECCRSIVIVCLC